LRAQRLRLPLLGDQLLQQRHARGLGPLEPNQDLPAERLDRGVRAARQLLRDLGEA